MAQKITQQGNERLRQRMLSGEPFTYGGLSREFYPETKDQASRGGDRAVDLMIQQLRRAGLISFKRIGRDVVWTAMSAGAEVARVVA